jgi:hypothetical protein
MVMSYPRDLDDYTEAELQGELKSREEVRALGVCDYCRRHPFTKPCKFSERHRDPRINATDWYQCTGTFRKFADYRLEPKARWTPSGDAVTDHTECNVCHKVELLTMEGARHTEILRGPVG